MGAAFVGSLAPAGGHVVHVHEDGGSRPLEHVVKHSPSGFSWGYRGSGPAELARCMLLHVLGDAAVCTVCGGTATILEGDGDPGHEVAIRSTCWGCDGGYLLRPVVYQDFKEEVVAGLPADEPFRLPVALVAAWLGSQMAIPLADRDAEFYTVAGVLNRIPE